MGGFNAALHPRGPNGRFTKSFATQLGVNGRKRRNKVKKAFAGRKPFTGPDEARDYLAGLAGPKAPDLAGVGVANKALRAGRDSDPAVKQLKSAMKPLPDDLTVWRKVPAANFGQATPQDLLDMKVADAGFFPATVAPQRAGPGEVQLRIDVPAGTPAAALPDSHEVVLDAGVEMAVDEVTTTPGGATEMHLVALPTAGTGASAAPPTVDAAPARPAGSFERQLGDAVQGDRALFETRAGMPPREPTRLSAGQIDAYDEYRDMGYQSINGMLRGQRDPNPVLAGDVAAMDAAMDSSPLRSDIVAYRGVMDARSMFGDRLDSDLSGMQWREDAYTSTSVDRSIAERFAADAEDPQRAVVMRMLVPAGTGAVALSGVEAHGNYDAESEVLLQRGMRMRVVSDRPGPPRTLDVEVVPDGEG